MTPTPQEKAKELVESMKYQIDLEHNNGFTYEAAKQCAIMAVNEVLTSFNSFMDSRRNFRHELEIEAENYWLQVKEQIQKL